MCDINWSDDNGNINLDKFRWLIESLNRLALDLSEIMTNDIEEGSHGEYFKHVSIADTALKIGFMQHYVHLAGDMFICLEGLFERANAMNAFIDEKRLGTEFRSHRYNI